MRDIGHEETEAILKKMEKEIAKEYAQAEKEIAAKLAKYLKDFEAKDLVQRKALADGLITEQEYKNWRVGQIMMGKRWSEMRDTLAKDFTNADKIAKSIAYGHQPDVYKVNYDYGTFQVEKASKMDTSYTLYDRHAFEQLEKSDGEFIPAPGRKVTQRIKEGKDLAWNKKQVQSVMMQGLLQGESIGKLSTRLAKTVGESDRKAAVRNARTMTTGVQNAGRIASYDRANDMGIKTKKQWLATLDNRTRHWHASLDGVTVDNDKPFVNEYGEIMYPGDPKADPANIYNCRCTLIASIKGFERNVSDLTQRNDRLGNMSYDEWRQGHYQQTSKPIINEPEVTHKGKKQSNDLNMGARSGNIKVEEVNVDRSAEINNFTTTDQIKEKIPTVDFGNGFEDMKFESQKEIAQGLNYMGKTYGNEVLPKKIIAVDDLGGNMAAYNVQTKTMKVLKNLDPGMALVATCHETVHAMDMMYGGISQDIIYEAYKRLGVRRNTRQATQLLYKSMGPRFMDYIGDYPEQLAWTYESSLYSKDDKFGTMVHTIIDERYGKKK